MAGKMRKNGFVEGAVIAYAAIVITKILGAFYNIPFYNIIGDHGSVLYSFAYSIYALFLDISTSGVPIAISIVISEYASKGMYRSKEKAYKLGLRAVLAISAIAFLLMQIFSKQIGEYYVTGMTEGVTAQEISYAVRVISICLIFVPFLSMERGYLQGHKCMGTSSSSQVTEQFVRIVFVLAGAYAAINIFNLGSTVGVCISLLGAAVGAVVALAQVLFSKKKSKELFEIPADNTEERPESAKQIYKKILTYCLSIVIISVSTNIYNIVDMKLLLVGLQNLSFPDEVTQTIASITSTWIPKIGMIVVALAMGLTNSIAPHMAESYAAGNMKDINRKLNQGMETIIVAAMPMALGVILLAEPVYRIFYGASEYGGSILQLSMALNVIGSLVSVVGMAMQSIDRGKAVCAYNIVGIMLNAALDLPFIYLFDRIGIPAYLGATAASIVGQSVTLILLLVSLKRQLKFEYMPAFKVLAKCVIPLALMSGCVILIKSFWPVTSQGTLLLIVQLGVYSVSGAIIYGISAYKFGLISEVLGQETIDRYLRKLHLKK